MKLILYKISPSFFDEFPFEDRNFYKEPYLFSSINRYKSDNEFNLYRKFQEVFWGYSQNKSKVTLKTDVYGNLYMPLIGWFKSKTSGEKFEIHGNVDDFQYSKNVTHVPRIFICNGDFEVYKYRIQELSDKFYDEFGNVIEVEIDCITNKMQSTMESAYKIIKQTNTIHYSRIKGYASKACIFKDVTGRRNSFADLAAHSMGFYNSYQDDYSKVFFIDDIAHQTGHVLMNIIARNISEHLIIDKTTIVENIKYQGETVEKRNIEVLYHALFTYYTTLDCLDKAYQLYDFNEIEKIETLGRIKFYLSKYYNDLNLLKGMGVKFQESSSNIFSAVGHQFINMYAKQWIEIKDKYHLEIKGLDLSDQPYNFTNKIFYEKNI